MATRDTDLSSLRIDRSSSAGSSQRNSRKIRKIIVWAIVVAAVVATAVLLKNWFNPGVEVQLATASLTSPSQANAVLTASGYVVARRKAAVASKGTGTLVYLAVEEGDQVKKGQVIARLDDSDVMASLQRARENLRVAEADLYDAKKNAERMRILLRQGMIAQAEYDVSEARYKRVVATIDAAKFGVREAQVAVDNTRIVAPFDGTVLKKNADVGEIVAPLAGAASSKAAVVTIADMSSLEVDADVSEANITRVASQQNCEIALDAYPQQRYPGYVSNIVPTADRAKATVMVKIKFKAYDQRVLPEMGAKITFLAPGSSSDGTNVKPVLTVPAAAMATRDGRQVVFQIKDERAVEIPVTTGKKLAGLIEITRGLKEGDKVISKADDQIKAGAKVFVKGK
ncbi:MAG TPA: efflux RND transporter periplasmic adaptor subunit [Candidatus Binatia bacterium]|jgi:RND family efflux transporter MFP subunit|nr:efflux RND transporter periplasmic adaptor subunit [Candidatus Binatia bacterium]